MYKLIKEKHYRRPVAVINTDTNKQIILGNPTYDLIFQLKGKGISEELLDPTKEWDITISKELATELAGTTLKMRKPIRDQRKKSEQDNTQANAEETKLEKHRKIDAYDVLLGLAHYE